MKHKAVVKLPALLESTVSPTVTAASTATLSIQENANIEPLESNDIDNTAGVEAHGLDNELDMDAMVPVDPAEKQTACTAAATSAKTASIATC